MVKQKVYDPEGLQLGLAICFMRSFDCREETVWPGAKTTMLSSWFHHQEAEGRVRRGWENMDIRSAGPWALTPTSTQN